MRKNFTIYLIITAILIGIIAAINLLPAVFFKAGLNEYKVKHFEKAHKYLSIAKNLKPDNKEYKYNYVLALASIPPTYNVQKEMYALSKDNVTDSAARLALVQTDFWKRRILKKYGQNYIEQTPYDSKIIRWDIASFPLKVYIDFPSNDKLPDYYREEISKALNQWETSSGFLKFTFTQKAKEAQIVIKFLPLPENNCVGRVCKYVVAFTEPTIKVDMLKKMTITLYDKDAYGNYFSDKELYNTILHEIGHALGIMGHSYSTDDLMYMSNEEQQNNIYTRFRSSFQYISAKDINTITLLYNLAPDISNIPVSKIEKEKLIYPPIILGTAEDMQMDKIKEAKNYIKKAPAIPNGYIDLGIAYAQLGQKNNALKALNKALELSKTPQDNYIVYYNMAVVEMNAGNLSKALINARKAQEYFDSEEISDLISNIEHAKSTRKKPFKDTFIEE